jgi:hypothetical protein
VNTVIYQNPETKKEECQFRAIFAGSMPQPVVDEDPRQAADTERFRSKAGVVLTTMIQEAKTSSVKPAKLVKRVAGGC